MILALKCSPSSCLILMIHCFLKSGFFLGIWWKCNSGLYLESDVHKGTQQCWEYFYFILASEQLSSMLLMKMIAHLASFWIRNVKHAYILKTNYPMSGKIKLLESCLYIKKNHSVMECSPGLIFAFYFLIGQ
jgi:hypothetical protein